MSGLAAKAYQCWFVASISSDPIGVYLVLVLKRRLQNSVEEIVLVCLHLITDTDLLLAPHVCVLISTGFRRFREVCVCRETIPGKYW